MNDTMAKGVKIGTRPVLIILSLALLCVVLFFSFTNTAWVLMGRPNEAYPELLFFIFGVPIALTSLVLSLLWKR